MTGPPALNITGLSVIGDGGEFRINGASGDLTASPITIVPGGSYNVSVTYTPAKTGLAHGVIQIKSNDPANPVVTAGVDGLGATKTSVGKWGKQLHRDRLPEPGR